MGQRGLLLRLTHAGTQLLLKSAIAAAGWHALWSCGTDLLAAPNVPVSHRFGECARLPRLCPKLALALSG